jgi:hypothetical protein
MAKAQSGSSKRPRSEKAKLIAGRCYARARQQHLVSARAQLAQYKHNLELIASGEYTAWQQSCMLRAARRLITCIKCRDVFDDDGRCVTCGGTANLASRYR